MTLDFTADHGKQALQQLENDPVIWLTTVTPKGVPQPNPVWFVWEDESFIIWVLANSARLRNLETNPNVSLNLVGESEAHHVTVLTGTAEVDASIGPLVNNAKHLAKYADRWRAMGMEPEAAAEEYSVPLRVRPTKLRGF